MFFKQVNWLLDASRYHAAVITAETDDGNKYNLNTVRSKEWLWEDTSDPDVLVAGVMAAARDGRSALLLFLITERNLTALYRAIFVFSDKHLIGFLYLLYFYDQQIKGNMRLHKYECFCLHESCVWALGF